jgi:hypothetical protein
MTRGGTIWLLRWGLVGTQTDPNTVFRRGVIANGGGE